MPFSRSPVIILFDYICCSQNQQWNIHKNMFIFDEVHYNHSVYVVMGLAYIVIRSLFIYTVCISLCFHCAV